MKIFELAGSFDPLLLKFWKTIPVEKLTAYATTGGCGAGARDFLNFLHDHGHGFAEMVPAGTIVNGKHKQGWFYVDQPDTSQGAFTNEDIAKMKKQNLNFDKLSDRKKYIINNNLIEDFKLVPHAWVELKGKILDPSGFYPNGTGGFDGWIKDKINLEDRYRYF